MRKFRLNIDELAVESFGVANEKAEPGTVKGHAAGGSQTFPANGCGQTQFHTCAWTNLGAPCFCQG